jgi:NADH-quinone oxidoreductase subunit G
MPGESSLDRNAAMSLRFAPGQAAAFAAALAVALRLDAAAGELERLAGLAGSDPAELRELATLLRGPEDSEGPREVVVLYGERVTSGPDGAAGATALLQIARRLGMAGAEGAGLLEIPASSNGRGLREAGVLPNAGPGYGDPPLPGGMDAHAIARALDARELQALYLLQSDPLRDLPDASLWRSALAGAGTVIAHASFLTETIAEHADVVFPAESYAEKEGTLVHPDGRLQRLRPAIARPGATRAGWQVISEIGLRLGLDLDVLSGAMASRRLFEAVPFYAAMTLEEIGGRGVRWQEREAAANMPAGASVGEEPPALAVSASDAEALPPAELAGFRSVWDAPEVLHSPALSFLYPRRELVSG